MTYKVQLHRKHQYTTQNSEEHITILPVKLREIVLEVHTIHPSQKRTRCKQE